MRAKVVTLDYPINNPAKRAVFSAPCFHSVMVLTKRTPDHGTLCDNWELLIAHANKSRALAIAARINRHV